ncbi:helix-turn-helix domain-containing protein [Actinomadura gamaensis]|uniref:Helix-turn-helix domain-containing protein n=1 Tax=Actinomadura gamaensis TaxID=1763541 RepID=A0ABV9TUC8_9ACTN
MSTDKKGVGARLRAAREAPPYWSRAEMARRLRAAADPADRDGLPHVPTLANMIKQWERGDHTPGGRYRKLYSLATGKSEDELFGGSRSPAVILADDVALDDETEALELARRIAASDVGDETLTGLEATVDELAVAYPRTPPGALLVRARRHLSYVTALMDARMTLSERRRLLVIGGWLSLLAATCDIDLSQDHAAAARLRTAGQLARHAEHREITAWCLETKAWQELTAGKLNRAVELARAAQETAPDGSSAFIQATAQEGRAWARLGKGREARNALGRVQELVSALPMPDRPEHHYRYDPAKSEAYTATTLSWLGDPAGERYARQVLSRLETGVNGPARPRRAASARLDLALALLTADQPDEAAHTALEAVTSGRLVPSNYWRAAEVLTAVRRLGVPEATELGEAYRELCVPSSGPALNGEAK